MNIKEKIRAILRNMVGPESRASLSRDELEEIAALLGVAEPDPLRVARAAKAKDVRHLKAEDILLEVLQMVREVPEDRDTRMVICWHTYAKAEPDGPVKLYRRSAGMVNSRLIATLFAEAVDVTNAWSDP